MSRQSQRSRVAGGVCESTGPCGRGHWALALLTIIKRDRYASESPLRKFATVFSQSKNHYGRQMWYQNDQKSVKFNVAVMGSRHYRAFAWGRHGQRDRKFGQTDGFYLVKTKERIFRIYFNTVKMPQCSVPGCTEMGAKYVHFTWWRGLFFFPTRAHSFFSTPLAVGEWSMTDIHSHETNPKQLTQWSAPIRCEITVPFHGGATWGDFSAGTSLSVSQKQNLKESRLFPNLPQCITLH